MRKPASAGPPAALQQRSRDPEVEPAEASAVAVPDAEGLIAKAQEAGLHASVVGVAKGADFASSGPKGELYRIPVAHLREIHEGWMPNWIEG